MRNKDAQLMQAIVNKNAIKVRELLKDGFFSQKADVNARDETRNITPLHVASQAGHSEICKILLENGANVEAKEKQIGATPLMIAIESENLEIVKLLLKHKAKTNYYDKTNEHTPLMLAVNKGTHAIAEVLLENGADPNAVCSNALEAHMMFFGATGRTKDGTALDIAIASNDPQMVDLLRSHGAKERDDPLALHKAIENSDSRKFEKLIKNGIDINFKDPSGLTPLHTAILSNNYEMVELLINKNVDVNLLADGFPPVWLAVKIGNTEIAKILIENGSDIGIPTENEKWNLRKAPILFYSIDNDDIEMLNFLIEQNVSIESEDVSGERPLQYAAEKGALNSTKLLIELGANLEAKDKNGWTALFYSVAHSHEHITHLLIDNGISINSHDVRYSTPLHYAVTLSNSANLNDFLTYHPEVNISNLNGTTPIHEAAQDGNIPKMDMLIKEGARISVRDNFRMTPIDRAISKNHAEAVNYLKDIAFKNNLKFSEIPEERNPQACVEINGIFKKYAEQGPIVSCVANEAERLHRAKSKYINFNDENVFEELVYWVELWIADTNGQLYGLNGSKVSHVVVTNWEIEPFGLDLALAKAAYHLNIPFTVIRLFNDDLFSVSEPLNQLYKKLLDSADNVIYLYDYMNTHKTLFNKIIDASHCTQMDYEYLDKIHIVRDLFLSIFSNLFVCLTDSQEEYTNRRIQTILLQKDRQVYNYWESWLKFDSAVTRVNRIRE